MDSHSRAGGNPFDTLQLDPRVRGDDTAESFQTTASRLAGLAGVLLGWRPSELKSRNSTTCCPSGDTSKMRAMGRSRLAVPGEGDKG